MSRAIALLQEAANKVRMAQALVDHPESKQVCVEVNLALSGAIKLEGASRPDLKILERRHD